MSGEANKTRHGSGFIVDGPGQLYEGIRNAIKKEVEEEFLVEEAEAIVEGFVKAGLDDVSGIRGALLYYETEHISDAIADAITHMVANAVWARD